MNNHLNFTEGKLFLPMVRFTGPILLASFLQTMYGAVDMLVVGQFATSADVSAVSTGSWFMTLITSFVGGIAMGTTVLLGMRLGEKRPEEAGKVIGASVILFLILGGLITVLMQIFSPTIAHIMQTPAEAYDATVAYNRICSAGTIFIIAYNVLGSIFRGIGNSKMPLISVAIACVVNIVGDLLLVGVFHMGTAGAAIATVLAQFLSVVLSLMIIAKQKLPFTLHKEDFGFYPQRMGQIVKLGFPIALQDTLVGVSFLVIAAIVNSLGVTVSAGVGVAEKLCGFVMLAPSSFGQSMAAVVSQNIGAQKHSRAKRALWYGILSSFVVGVVMAYFTFFHGDLLSAIFSKDPAVVATAAHYLKAYAIDCLLTAVLFCAVGYFNGCGKTTFVMIQGIIGAFCVRIPVSFFMSRMEPVDVFQIGLATPASSFLQIILCGIYFYYLNRRIQENSANRLQ